MLKYEDALAQILELIPLPSPERVPLAEAHRRILSERIVSPWDLPPFDNSAVDGYAVRAKEVPVGAAELPKNLRLRGKVAAGESFSGSLESGECVRIFTGSPLPAGADAVAMQEDTSTDPAKPELIQFLDGVRPWENVRFRGEDVKRGTAVGEPGDELSAGHLGLLSALGLPEVRVGRRPVAALLASGSELIEPGQPLTPGGIYESNRIALAALMNQAGATVKIPPLVKDTPVATRAALESAFADCDLVVTCGGVSVGEFDFIKSAFKELGGELEFWRVAIRPGRPFVFGRWQRKFLFGLPGNPVSAFVTFLLLVRPALRRWQGAKETGLLPQSATLAESLSNPGERRHFMRVRIDADGKVHSAGGQASHMLSSLATANALVDVPPLTTFVAGDTVQALRWE